MVVQHVTPDATPHKVLDPPRCRDVRVHRDSDLRPIRENVPALEIAERHREISRADIWHLLPNFDGVTEQAFRLTSPTADCLLCAAIGSTEAASLYANEASISGNAVGGSGRNPAGSPAAPVI